MLKKILLILILLFLSFNTVFAQLKADDTNFDPTQDQKQNQSTEEIAESAFQKQDEAPQVEINYYTAKVIDFIEKEQVNPDAPDDQPVKIKHALIEILDKPYKGKQIFIPWMENKSGKMQTVIKAEKDDKILIQCTKINEEENCSVIDKERKTCLWFLFILFLIVIYLVSKWYGIRAVIGLAFTALVILKFLVPQIANGADPVMISILSIALFIIPTMLFTHGLKVKTYVAILGVIFSVIIVAILAKITINWSGLIGLASEESLYINLYADKQINLVQLLLAGIILGAVGVMNDIALTQSSIVDQFKKSHPDANWKEIFKKSMIVGNDHISSVINTLFLAYMGVSLPLILLIQQQNIAFGIAIQREFIATEVIRILTSTIGLVLTVPLTTFVAAIVANRLNLKKYEYSFDWNKIQAWVYRLIKKKN